MLETSKEAARLGHRSSGTHQISVVTPCNPRTVFLFVCLDSRRKGNAGMNSGLIGKVDKAKRYAQERDRMHVSSLKVDFQGENDSHEVALESGRWRCTCDFFGGWGACAHTMALERVLDGMIPASAITAMLAQAS